MAAFPVYIMCGQESFRGNLAEAWLTNNADDRWDDAEATVDIYHHVNAVVDTYDTTPGVATSNTEDAGDYAFIALDVSAVRYLFDNDHPTGMVLAKRTDQGAVGGSGTLRWGKTHAESYPNIVAAWDALETLVVGRGDTMDLKGIFLSVGYQEGILDDTATNDAFEVDLKQFILDLRTDYGTTTTPVVMDLPPASVTGFTAGQNASLVLARQVIKKVASEDDTVSYVSADDLARSNSATKWYYTGEATIEQGLRLGKEMSRMVSGKGANPGTGVPVYAMIGDDNCVGSVAGSFLTTGSDDAYSSTMDNVKTWNWANETWEKLTATINSNSSTDGSSNFGPDVSMGTALANGLHDGQTVYLFKLGRNTSSLGNGASSGGAWPGYLGDIYLEVTTDWALALTAMDTAEGAVADVRGLVIIIGQEDVSTQELADAFLANLRITINDYRQVFQTRVDGAKLPVVVARMQDTGAYVSEYVATVRDACERAAAEDGRVAVVSLDSARSNSDGATLSGGGLLTAGELIAEGFASLA